MNPTIFKCEYCESIFATKSNLSYHKKKAKFCLLKRGEDLNKVIRTDNICEYCEKKFSSKQRVVSHKEICRKKDKENFPKEMQDKDTLIFTLKTENITLKSENDHLRELIESLQDKLASIAIEGIRKTTKITNNTTNNTTNNNVTQILSPFDLDQKDILCIIEEKLDENSFLNSQRGIAKFCVDNILKTEDGKMRMICTDPSRERFKYMDENGVIKEDIQARQFIEKIYPPIHKIGEKIHENILEKCKTQHIKIASGEDDTEKYMVKVREEAAHNSWTDIRFMKSRTDLIDWYISQGVSYTF